MKRIIFTAIIALAAWCNMQAQSMPAPDRYNEYLEQVAALEPTNAAFLMEATMQALADNPKGYRQMMELAEKRFSDPADPIHNESLYLAVLKHATENFVLSAGEKEKQRLLMMGAQKNKIGSTAADFDYVTPDDKTVHHLKDLKADYILVYFNNPDCESCEAVKERLASNETVNKLVSEKKLIVLGIYPYDDQKLWKKAKYPKMMINGWNQSQQIEYAELYDLPTLPCFYLMDRNYKVLVKNEGSLNKVEAMLRKLTSPQPMGPAEAPHAPTTAQAVAQPKPSIAPAPADDPLTSRCDQILSLLVAGKSQELYDGLSDRLKAKAKPTDFENVIPQIESQMGTYLGHEPWNIQTLQGYQAYTSMMNFEKAQLGFIIIYDNQGKPMAINIVPGQSIKPKAE